jgi:hypothetical protein
MRYPRLSIIRLAYLLTGAILFFPQVSSARRIKNVTETNQILTMSLPLEESSVLVLQEQTGVTRGSSRQRYLITTGLTSCVAVTLYCRETKIGALAHMDINCTDSDVMSTIQRMTCCMKDNKADLGQLEAGIIEGTEHSRALIDAICQSLAVLGIKIVKRVGIQPLFPRSIVFDAKTGEPYNLSGVYTIDPLSEYPALVKGDSVI